MCKRRCIEHKIHVQPRIAEAYEHRKAAWRSVQLPYINPLSNLAPPKQGKLHVPTYFIKTQQVAIITAGGLLGIHTSHSSNLKAH